MDRRIFLSLVLVVSVAICGLVPAACALTEGQDKLLAKRAAQADAYRNLAERVYGLQIDSQTYVRDFVAVSDQVRTDVDIFLRGARVTNVRYLPDGTCEVEVEMTIQAIVAHLQKVKESWGIFGGWRKVTFKKIYDYTDAKIIRAIGSGVPRSQAGAVVTPQQPQQMAASPTAGIPGWEGVTARGRLMAQRAALADAYRNMAERVKGLRIDSQTYVRDFVADSDQINTYLNTFIQGVRPISPYRYTPEGICEVDVQIKIEQIVKRLKTIQKKIRGWNVIRYKTIKIEEILDYGPPKVIRVAGSGVPPEKYRIQGGSSSIKKDIPSWAHSALRATGTGLPPDDASGTEARLLAERAAEVEAKRNLAELLYGVNINSTTTVRDFIVQHDEIIADIDVHINGAQVVDRRYFDDNSVEVDVEMPLGVIWEIVSIY